MPPSLIEQVDAWAKDQKTDRSDAIRRLVELGLYADGGGDAMGPLLWAKDEA